VAHVYCGEPVADSPQYDFTSRGLGAANRPPVRPNVMSGNHGLRIVRARVPHARAACAFPLPWRQGYRMLGSR